METIELSAIVPPLVLLRLVDTQSVEFLELVDSMQTYGLLQPIAVRARGDKWEIVDGVHRYKAATELGWTTIPCVVVDVESDDEALLLTVQANAITKETLPCEYAAHLRRYLKRNPELTIAGLSQLVKKSPTWISNCLLLSDLDEATQKSVNRGEIPLQSAYLLAKIPRHLRSSYVVKAQLLSAQEFRIVATEVIRRWKESVREGRTRYYYPDEFKVRQYVRPLRELRAENDNPEAGPRIIVQESITTPLEAWKAAIRWVLHIDPDSVEEQRRLHAMYQRKPLGDSDVNEADSTD